MAARVSRLATLEAREPRSQDVASAVASEDWDLCHKGMRAEAIATVWLCASSSLVRARVLLLMTIMRVRRTRAPA